MERVFIQDVPARFRIGDVRDYPLSTWNDIARSHGAKSVSDIALPPGEAVLRINKEKQRQRRFLKAA